MKWCETQSIWKDYHKVNRLMSLASFLSWQIWKERNNLVFNKIEWDPVMIIEKALFFFNEFNGTLSKETSNASSTGGGIHHTNSWVSPALGRYKLNTDASFHKLTRYNGSGLVLRNHCGEAVKRLQRL
ncbi:uncharacterized protein LOC132314775 [Cornus florida]|uniref:uncharacterized protein LOC132314775 n=1 Tax=Cornus florida TaxID=4283 RepID=UPI00289F5F6D|nr:uncharacterized protein LOC132314775 [Cornus florida]